MDVAGILKKLYLANLAIFAVVAGLSALLLTTSYSVPPPPPDPGQFSAPENAAAPDSPDAMATAAQEYPNLGKKPIFETLYPKPTPNPTPVPTPKPDEALDRITATWKLVSILPGGIAFFEDSKSREEWQMNTGEAKSYKYKSETFDVVLQSTNDADFTCVIAYTGPSGKKQTRTLSMFD